MEDMDFHRRCNEIKASAEGCFPCELPTSAKYNVFSSRDRQAVAAISGEVFSDAADRAAEGSHHCEYMDALAYMALCKLEQLVNKWAEENLDEEKSDELAGLMARHIDDEEPA